MTRPIKFQPGVLYPLPWLEKRLAGVMAVKTFLDNLGLDCAGRGRLYQNAVWGDEILRAMDCSCGGGQTRQAARMDVSAHIADGTDKAKRKRGRPAKAGGKIDLITAADLS